MIQTKAVGGSPGFDPAVGTPMLPPAPGTRAPTALPTGPGVIEPQPVAHTTANIGTALADRPNPGIGWIH